MIYYKATDGKEYFYATTSLGVLRIKYLDLPIHETGVQIQAYKELVLAKLGDGGIAEIIRNFVPSK